MTVRKQPDVREQQRFAEDEDNSVRGPNIKKGFRE